MSRLNPCAPAVLVGWTQDFSLLKDLGMVAWAVKVEFLGLAFKAPSILLSSAAVFVCSPAGVSLFLGTFQMVGLTPSSRTMFVQRCWLIFRPSSEPQRCWRPPQRRLHGLSVGLASLSIKRRWQEKNTKRKLTFLGAGAEGWDETVSCQVKG